MSEEKKEAVVPLAQPDPETASLLSGPISPKGLSEDGSKKSSTLRAKLLSLYSEEFKRLKAEFETTTIKASIELEKCKSLNASMKAEQDNDRRLALQDVVLAQQELAQTVNRKVRELNVRMTVLKSQFDQRLLKITDKEVKRDTLLGNLTSEESRNILTASFDRLSKLLFVPRVDKLTQGMSSSVLYGNSVEEIYQKSPLYEPHLGVLLAHCHDFDRFMVYSQKRFAKYLCREDYMEPAVQQFILGTLFRVLDGLSNDKCASILTDFKVKDDLIGYDNSVDLAIKINEAVAVYVVKVGLGDGLETGLPRLLAALDSSKIAELMNKQSDVDKFSYGIVTSGQYWELIRLNHITGEYSFSETLGPIDISYGEPGLENENVLPLCRNILGMLEESIKK